jgi:outer membrane protein assembly factor BamB
MTIRGILAMLAIWAAVAVNAQEPQTLWSFQVDSVVQPAPLVADFDSAPGLETIVTVAAGRQLLCLRANGKEAWRLEPAFAAQMSAPPALSANAADGLRVAAAFGHEIVCIDPASQRVDWAVTVDDGPVHSVHWADVDGDTWHDLAAATATTVYVFDAQGKELFAARGEPDSPLAISGPLALADADLNDAAESYGAGARGVFSLDDRGLVRWQTAQDTAFGGAPIVADTNADSFAEVYAVAPDGPFLCAFDADLGEVLWKTWLPGEIAPGVPALATGDLDGDGVGEVIVGLPNGHVYAVGAGGALLWGVQPGEAVPLALALGDVNGNGLIDILAASMGGSLHALDGKGNALWQMDAGQAITHPPVLTDMDQDGKTDIIFAARDGYVRCASLGGRFVSRLMPWPEAGAGSTRSHAALATPGGDEFEEMEEAGPAYVPDSMPLLPLAGFDLAAKDGSPLGWTRISAGEAALALDLETKLTGPSALQVEAVGEPCVLVSELVPIDPELQGVSGSVSARSPSAALAALRWLGDAGLIREDPFDAGQPQENGWRRFNLAQMAPPARDGLP